MSATVPIVNEEQAEAWDGHEGDVWSEHADRYDRAGGRIWNRFLTTQHIEPTDAVLDVGCGTGRPTNDIARIASGGDVVGVDLSTRMLAIARARAADEGLTNVTFLRGDAQVHPFVAGGFDLVISSFGGMFFGDPVAAYANLARCLRPEGRLALLAWRGLGENEWLTALRGALAMGRTLPVPPPHVPSPFSLADAARVQELLGAAGFRAIDLEPVDEPMDLGPSVEEAERFVSTIGIVEGLSEGLDDAQRAAARRAVRSMLEAHVTDEGVLLDSASWLITASRA